MLFHQVLKDYEAKAPRAMEVLETGFDDATAVLALPERYCRCLRTTNGVERLIEEIRRRERVIRIFPNRESVFRLLGALLMEIDEKWTSGRKYLEMTEYLKWRETVSSSTVQGCAHWLMRNGRLLAHADPLLPWQSQTALCSDVKGGVSGRRRILDEAKKRGILGYRQQGRQSSSFKPRCFYTQNWT